jgi:hypothetical protein
MNALSDFIISEREKYLDDYGNLFAVSLSQVQRYYDFILIIADRCIKANHSMISNRQKMMGALSAYSSEPLTDEQMDLFEEVQRITVLVHLEIESSYLFAKILIDKIALFLQNYFGQAHGISLVSHDKLTKYHKQYCAAKGLVYPDGFTESLQLLKNLVCDYRDKQISHLQNLRTIRATILNDTNSQAKIAEIRLYPNSNELNEQATSMELPELLSAINNYIQQVIAVIELNRVKTRFKLKENSDIS